MTWELLAFDRPEHYQESLQEAHAGLTPPEGVSGQLAELWTLNPKPDYPPSPDTWCGGRPPFTGVLDEVTSAGAHTEVWSALAEAIPLLLPGPGEKARAGLGELLKVAVRAAESAGARGEIPGLGDLAARKGSSQLLHQARRLYEVIGG